MRTLLFTTFFFFQVSLCFGQTSLSQIGLDKGKYQVGLKHYTSHDSSRTYNRIYDYTNQKIARPISVSIWYPSNDNITNLEPLRILHYFEILKEEEEWEYLPNEQLLNWFYYANTPANQAHLQEKTTSYLDLGWAKGKFPVIIYTASQEASSIENFGLCEYLASHGYIVVSTASRGTENRWMNNNFPKEIETQARDVEFLITEVAKIPNADIEKLAVAGFSFGGLSNITAQMRNDKIKAIVSLDGTERYQYALIQKSPFFDLDQIDVPYLHMAQKDIPEKVLQSDKIDAKLNSIFELYDNITKSDAYRLKFTNLTHSYFSTLGVLFQARDPRQDKSDTEIMESHKWVCIYTLNFLNTYLKRDPKASKFINNKPLANKVPDGLIKKSSKKATIDLFSFRDFNELAIRQHYENLSDLYKTTLKEHPGFQIPEGDLNRLGLQLIFNPKASQKGINVFLFALELYPESANLFDSLGEAYLFIDNKEKAVINFKKSLELYPQNQNAINRLKQLEE